VEFQLLVPETDPATLMPLDAACLQVAPGGFVVEGADAPPGTVAPVPAGHLRYRVYVGEPELASATHILEAALSGIPGSTLETGSLPEGWRDRWKEWFKPLPISDQLWVTTPWHDVEAPASAELIVIEPGLAFGTGQHETTWLCLEDIDERAVAGTLPERMLDVGCGSGILAIAALRRGSVHANAIDYDPQAVRATHENAVRNGVAAFIETSTTPIADVTETYPLVIANIMAHILIRMSEPLTRSVGPQGILILSGILHEQAAEVITVFEGQGLQHVHTATRGGWVRIEFKRAS
jgi:ribosomal protein L11 methyltransferase